MKTTLILLSAILLFTSVATISKDEPCTPAVPMGTGRWVNCGYIHSEAETNDPYGCAQCHGEGEPPAPVPFLRIDTRDETIVSVQQVTGDQCTLGNGEVVPCAILRNPPDVSLKPCVLVAKVKNLLQAIRKR